MRFVSSGMNIWWLDNIWKLSPQYLKEMTLSASSTDSGPSKTPVTGNLPMSKNIVASDSYSSDAIEGSSKATNDLPQGSTMFKTSQIQTSSETLWLLAHSHSSCFPKMLQMRIAILINLRKLVEPTRMTMNIRMAMRQSSPSRRVTPAHA